MCESPSVDVFGVMAGFIVFTSHVFPQGVLAAITLIGGVTGVGRARACAECEAGLPLCSVAITALSGLRSAPQVDGADALRVRLELTVFSLSVFFLLPALGPLPQRRGVAVISGDRVLSEV